MALTKTKINLGTEGNLSGSRSLLGIENTLVSSSAQLATSISGSFTAASSSFSTRVTRNEATGSSLTSASSSFSTRVTRNEASASALTTDSGSFSTRITAATSSISAIKTDSGSFSTRITTNTSTGSILAGSGNIQGLGSTNSPTFVNVTATGTMTAQEFHTEFVSASIVYTSGSTKFGDTIDDIHSFTGSINQSGSFNLNDGNMSVTDTLTATTLTGTTMKDFTTISGSVSSTGSFGAVSVAGMSNSNLVDVSSSLSTRVSNLKTDSGSFSTRVTRNEATGSSLTTASSSFSTRVTRNEATGSSLSAASSSFSSRVTTNEGKATKGFTIAMSVAL